MRLAIELSMHNNIANHGKAIICVLFMLAGETTQPPHIEEVHVTSVLLCTGWDVICSLLVETTPSDQLMGVGWGRLHKLPL